MSLLNCSDYKDFIRWQIQGHLSVKGYRSKLADAAGCQKTYLSQILKSNAHLTPEHAIGLAAFWGFNSLETDYWLGLVNLGRTSHFQLKRKIEEQLAEIRRERENLAKRFHTTPLENYESQSLYYSSPFYGIIHMMVGLNDCRTVSAISRRLNIPTDLASVILNNLKDMSLVKSEGDVYFPTEKSLHLPKDSPLNYFNHKNWRDRGLLDVQSKYTEGIHYSSIHTMTKDDFLRAKETLIKMIEALRKTIQLSQEEDVVCFTCDWFTI